MTDNETHECPYCRGVRGLTPGGVRKMVQGLKAAHMEAKACNAGYDIYERFHILEKAIRKALSGVTLDAGR